MVYLSTCFISYCIPPSQYISLAQQWNVSSTMSSATETSLSHQWVYAYLQLDQLYLSYVNLIPCISSSFHAIRMMSYHVKRNISFQFVAGHLSWLTGHLSGEKVNKTENKTFYLDFFIISEVLSCAASVIQSQMAQLSIRVNLSLCNRNILNGTQFPLLNACITSIIELVEKPLTTIERSIHNYNVVLSH